MQITRITETISFRDGSQLIVSEASYSMDVQIIRLEKSGEALNIEESQRIQDEGGKITIQDVDFWFFRLALYPKLAACSSRPDGSEIPSEREAFELPTAELSKWSEAARRVNPHWFAALDSALTSKSENELSKDEKETLKKKEPKPARSKRRSVKR